MGSVRRGKGNEGIITGRLRVTRGGRGHASRPGKNNHGTVGKSIIEHSRIEKRQARPKHAHALRRNKKDMVLKRRACIEKWCRN